MKTILLSLILVSWIPIRAQEAAPDATPVQPSVGGFAAGLLSEEGEGDLAAAAAAYRQTIQEFDRQRDEAANAVFRLGEVYRKLGRIEEAKVQYARILREFPDMVRLTEISHNLLYGEVARATGGGGGNRQDRLQSIVSSRMGGGGGGVAGDSGGGGMGVGGMPGTGATTKTGTDVRADARDGYIDAALSSRYGTTILGRPGTKPQSAEEGVGGTAGGSDSAVPGSSERIMMQRYGIKSSAGERAQRIACVNNLKQLGLAALVYSTDHEGVFPSAVGVMSNEISVSKVLVCPEDPRHSPAPSWGEFDHTAHMSYEYLGASAREDYPQTVLFRCPIHGHVALVDGSVQQGPTAAPSVAPEMSEIMRQRYELSGAGQTASTPNAGTSQWDSIAIAFLRDGSLTLNGGPMDLSGVTQLIQQMPDEMRSTTIIELQADPETDFSSIGAVLDACQEARVVNIRPGAGTRAAILQEIERLRGEYKSLQTKLNSNQREAHGLNQPLDQFKPEIDQARARQTLAKERLEALSFPAERLPAVVGQDARYQRLKAEFETAVLDGDKAAQERARARLQKWVGSIYRPELESEAELADRRLAASVAEAEQLLQKQQALLAQRTELEGKLNASTERMNELMLLRSPIIPK